MTASLAMVVALVATGCGGGDDDGSAPDTGPGPGDTGPGEVDAGPPPPPPPSCAGGLTCGSVSCCDSKVVTGGMFLMGRSAVGGDVCPAGFLNCLASEQPQHVATVDSFALDTYEVTVGRFRKFVEGYAEGRPTAGAGAHPNVPETGWRTAFDASLPADQAELIAKLNCNPTLQTWTDTPGANENKPVTCVDWYMALAFCIWDGGRLPTEAEWEYAAAGGADNRLFPWGSEAADNTRGNFVTGSGLAREVGQYPAGVGKYGQHDMAGNVWEWVVDWHTDTWYEPGPGNPCDNCANTASDPDLREGRGGAFDYPGEFGRAAQRWPGAPHEFYANSGFRCARTP